MEIAGISLSSQERTEVRLVRSTPNDSRIELRKGSNELE